MIYTETIYGELPDQDLTVFGCQLNMKKI